TFHVSECRGEVGRQSQHRLRTGWQVFTCRLGCFVLPVSPVHHLRGLLDLLGWLNVSLVVRGNVRPVCARLVRIGSEIVAVVGSRLRLLGARVFLILLKFLLGSNRRAPQLFTNRGLRL